MLRVGLIGCGGIAQAHMRGWQAMSAADQAQVTAVSDVVVDNARATAAKVGATAVFADYHDLIVSPNVDAVDICLPHNLHADAIIAATKAGKHIMCEKPLCMTLAEADQIVDAVAQSKVTFMAAHNQLFDPCFQRARQMIDSGELGSIFMVRTLDCFRHRFKASDWAWRGEMDKMGGGELIDTGFHPTYMMLYLAASAPREVQAMMSNFVHPSLPAEDSAQVMVKFESGAFGHLLTSWAFERPDGGFQFQVIGDKGQLSGLGPRLQYHPMGGWQPAAVELAPVDTFSAEIAHFVESLRLGKTPIQTAVDGRNVLRLIKAAYEAAETGRAVRVDQAAAH